MTRIQNERFDNPVEYEKLKGSFILTRAILEKGNKEITVMHPLPRVDEITTDVDSMPNAVGTGWNDYLDTNGDGLVTGADDPQLMPVSVRIRWRSPSGIATQYYSAIIGRR